MTRTFYAHMQNVLQSNNLIPDGALKFAHPVN